MNYLFTAVFTDGSTIEQTQEDKSTLVEGKNTYYDVLHAGKRLKEFRIREQKLWNPTDVSVNLITGIITVNGVKLYYEELPVQYPDFELYWMMHVVQTIRVQKHHMITSSTPMPEQRTFFLGWKTTINNKEYQHIVGVI